MPIPVSGTLSRERALAISTMRLPEQLFASCGAKLTCTKPLLSTPRDNDLGLTEKPHSLPTMERAMSIGMALVLVIRNVRVLGVPTTTSPKSTKAGLTEAFVIIGANTPMIIKTEHTNVILMEPFIDFIIQSPFLYKILVSYLLLQRYK